MKLIKLITFSSLLFFFIPNGWAQKKLAPNPFIIPKKTEADSTSTRVSGISPTTAFLLMDLKRGVLSAEELIDKYALIQQGGKLYAHTFIKNQIGYDIDQLISFGVIINQKQSIFATALVPIEQLETLAGIPELINIQIGDKVYPTMDQARTATNVHLVHSGTTLPQPYFGADVVVGIIDIGFDYTHPNFYDSTGEANYRVKRVWEQEATSGTPPDGFTYGRELKTTTSIISAQKDRTNQSHGTHVAGIAAGAGGPLSDFSGVAPQADLVFVSTTMTDLGILDAISYIQTYADAVGKPCVINMSIGGHVGPHDGSSYFDWVCDSFFVGPGRILVGSAGNEGGDSIHIQKTFSGTDSSLFTFIKFPYGSPVTNGSTVIDIWGEEGENFYTGAYIYNVLTDEFEDATTYLYGSATTGEYSDTLYDGDYFSDACYVDIYTGIDAENNKPRHTMIINNTEQDDNYRYLVIEMRAYSGQVHMWAATGGAIFVDNGYEVTAGNTNSTVGEIGGTGKSMISVGAYTSKNSWTSLSGASKTAGFYSEIGDIAPFSSKGPTVDGRKKPDITAPGNVIVSSVNSYHSAYDYYTGDVVDGLTDGTNEWYFATMQGTSMSAPMVTGIIALWLEMYPGLTPDMVKEYFQTTSITDSYTGPIGSVASNTWGWGKINALIELSISVPDTPVVSPGDTTICVGESVTLTAPSGYASYLWNTGSTTASITVTTSGSYKVKVTNEEGIESAWSEEVEVTVQPLPATPTITSSNDTLISSATSGNQWYKDGTAISGATSQKYKVTESGTYKVKVTNSSGCSKESDLFNVTFPDQPTISPGDTAFCKGETITLHAPAGYTAYRWNTDATTSSITVSASGTFKVKVTNEDGFESAWSEEVTVTVHPLPATPSITQSNDTLTSSAATGNQWFKDGTAIAGATAKKYKVIENGTYSVKVSGEGGCTKESNKIKVKLPTGLNEDMAGNNFLIYPNPTDGILYLKLGQNVTNLQYELVDMQGRVVWNGSLYSIQKGASRSIDLRELPNGIYLLILRGDGLDHKEQITIQR